MSLGNTYRVTSTLLLLIATGCSGVNPIDPKPPLLAPFSQQISMSIVSIKSNFNVNLPTLSLTDPCAALHGAQRACLKLALTGGNNVYLQGDLVVPGPSSYCASANLTGDVGPNFDESQIVDVDFMLLNDTSACAMAEPISDGGDAMGDSELLNTQTRADGFTDYNLQYLAYNSANLMSVDASQGRAFHTATLINSTNELLITGGVLATGDIARDTLLIGADGNLTVNGPMMQCARQQHVAIYVDAPGSTLHEKIVIAGGKGDGGCSNSDLSKLEVYDPITNSVQFLTALAAPGNTQRFSSARYGIQATLLPAKGVILFSGGRYSSNDAPVFGGDASYYLDLADRTLHATAPNMSTSLLDHASFTVNAGGVDEAAVLFGGLNDLNWDDSSYMGHAEGYVGEIGTDFIHYSSTMNGAQLRHLATAIPLPQGSWGLVGGRYMQLIGGNAYEIRNDVVRWQIAASGTDDSITTLGALMTTPRFGMQGVSLAANSQGNTSLLIGGAQTATSGAPDASSALEYLYVDPTASVSCFKKVRHTDPATGNMQDVTLVQARYGHTATRLSDGKIVVFGGFNGKLNSNPTVTSFADADDILANYELLPQLSPPTDCN